jgi:hypothetical protein
MPEHAMSWTEGMLASGHSCRRARAVCLLSMAMCAFALPVAPARGVTSASLSPTLTPDRLGAKATLTLGIRYADSGFGIPSPVQRSILRLPAGLSLNIPSLRTCIPARLLTRGTAGCPAQSEIGTGTALVEVQAGSFVLSENVLLSAFLGAPRNLQPTFEILGRGHTPLDERMVFTGTVLPGSEPYGEALSMSLPPIPTMTFEPDASIVAFSLTIGTTHLRRAANTVVMPSSCPPGGFPFAAEFTYADGSSSDASNTVACPRPSGRRP